MLSHQTLKIVADSVNPSLAVLVLALPFARWKGQLRIASAHIAVTLVTVMLTYLLRGVFNLESVWASWGLDFSTHGAICIVLVVALSSLEWKRVWIWAAIFVSYDALMIYQSYHSWVDIATTSVVMFPFSIGVRYLGDRLGGGAFRSRRALPASE